MKCFFLMLAGTVVSAISTAMFTIEGKYVLAFLNLLVCVTFICSTIILHKCYREIRILEDHIISDATAKDIEKQKQRIADCFPWSRRILYLIDRYVEIQHRENDSQAKLRQVELSTLQSQINPHFLYNTLDTIRGQAMVDHNKTISDMVESLSSFFRYSISRTGNIVTLREEINNIRHYVRIQQFRFPNRFELEVLIDEDETYLYDCYIPRLTLQPIIENAIAHGFKDVYRGGVITIEVSAAENMIVLISDNGVGIGLEQLSKLNDRIRNSNNDNISVNENGDNGASGSGIALINVHKRIRLLYGEKFGLTIYSSFNQGTDVEIILPLMKEISGKGNFEIGD